MKPKFRYSFAPVLAIAAMVTSNVCAQNNAPVKVTAWGMHHGGQVVYKYSIQNSGASPINRFVIGLNPAGASTGALELSVAPNYIGNPFWLPTEAAHSPDGWGALMKYEEESQTFGIEWIEAGYNKNLRPGTPQESGSPAIMNPPNSIPAGATWNQFSVILGKPDFAYVQGHATVEYNGDNIVVPITKGDKQPPIVQMQGTATPAGVHYAIEPNLLIKDDVDPAPEHTATLTRRDTATGGNVENLPAPKHLKQFRVTAFPGKTYTLTVTAQDASGNTGSASYSWSIPQKGAAR
ncbi:hypothetical protein ACQZ32_00080 [Ralstonia pseudosolanacearum]|uniref:hypothetical protein n=1 Tax=Ralstonia pseudosolanacearum TaxID=1310165 RepID=UPI000AF86FA5|nr:hypothetical protein [Ralstonia pseudosolanacearum]MDC6291838.1 hypothetical protein [Ralstonia pseudosolanacearum]MDD7787669.1 hypothetical protein [Ralstonia pseudosolanacearum]MDN3369086.1 hypothetical protein [Ralstonia pseudosolanacearum]QOK89647.1 Ig-like domain-containing protein [Ralstonia pseudosolanacearum]